MPELIAFVLIGLPVSAVFTLLFIGWAVCASW
jgi:hypothetical protein